MQWPAHLVFSPFVIIWCEMQLVLSKSLSICSLFLCTEVSITFPLAYNIHTYILTACFTCHLVQSFIFVPLPSLIPTAFRSTMVWGQQGSEATINCGLSGVHLNISLNFTLATYTRCRENKPMFSSSMVLFIVSVSSGILSQSFPRHSLKLSNGMIHFDSDQHPPSGWYWTQTMLG